MLTMTKAGKNTHRYDVPTDQFGVILKSGFYLTTKALHQAFGYVPGKVRIIVEVFDE